MRLEPVVDARLVDPALAPRVVAPAYDLLSGDDRRRILAAEPLSFLHAMRSSDEYDEPVDDARILADSRAGLRRILDAGGFRRLGEPVLFVYRLVDDHHVQTGVVGEVGLDGRVLPHETTLTAKEEQLARHLAEVGFRSSPIGLGHRPDETVRALVAQVTSAPPDLEVLAGDGVRQQVWVVRDGGVAALREAFTAVPVAYVVDGHHRVAAARRLGHDAVFAVLFPGDELRVVGFHRGVRTLGRPVDEVVAALRTGFRVVPVGEPTAPQRPATLVVWLRGRAYRLERDLDDRLDVEVLHEDVLTPVLGITDPRTDPRLVYLPGGLDVATLVERATTEGLEGLFLLPPMRFEDIAAAADAGRTMPPKSTWFSPKVRSGVFLAPAPQ